MRILVVAGQPRLGLVEPELREQGDTVERLLPMGDHVVAERLDLQPREGLVDAFDLLEADDVRLALLQPGQQQINPLPDRVHVPGGNSDGHVGGLRAGAMVRTNCKRARQGARKISHKINPA
ncbi:hypothetical protein ACVW0I_004461 [Bradyrhizobium sp. LM6.11]